MRTAGAAGRPESPGRGQAAEGTLKPGDPSSSGPTRQGAPVLPVHTFHSSFLLLWVLDSAAPCRPQLSLLQAFPGHPHGPGVQPRGRPAPTPAVCGETRAQLTSREDDQRL
uniref:Uncharacterized protein n=1 Tax=Rangifer tarandus platyrhynchus TaxID=3082113 RepID=A0ACB0DZU7_RANTA|nr:unnamed protein product [Rangifer tarandus platyrhynchus]